jgi:hypothetical protein
MTIHEAHRLQVWEEALGTLKGLKEQDSYLVANIGPISVYLPIDMGDRLRELLGQRIGILRTDKDLRLRVISVIKSAGSASSNSLSVLQDAL